MKTSTTSSITHRTALDPDEWFTVKLADRVMSVDGVTAHRASGDDRWAITLHGNRVLKSGAFGQRQKATTWEHSRSFRPQANVDLWNALSDGVKKHLDELGVVF